MRKIHQVEIPSHNFARSRRGPWTNGYPCPLPTVVGDRSHLNVAGMLSPVHTSPLSLHYTRVSWLVLGKHYRNTRSEKPAWRGLVLTCHVVDGLLERYASSAAMKEYLLVLLHGLQFYNKE